MIPDDVLHQWFLGLQVLALPVVLDLSPSHYRR